MNDLPAGVIRLPAPPELMLGEQHHHHNYDWHRSGYQLDFLTDAETAKAFPEPVPVDAPETLRSTTLFACSGGVDSSRYQEATKYRTMPQMGWEEARVALNRLYHGTYVELAAFAITATHFDGFEGKKGDHAGKLRSELRSVLRKLHSYLSGRLVEAESNARSLAKPMTQHAQMRRDDPLKAAQLIMRICAVVPTEAGSWVRIAEATPEQILASLDYLRSTLATWDERLPGAIRVANRLALDGDKLPPDPPSAAEYSQAVHIVDMVICASTKLLALYTAIMMSMPIYRLYPATSEAEAIELWWPWGRPPPLVDGPPPRPLKPRKVVIDPSIITAPKPQDVVREVMAKTGINRTTAQRMTASMRAEMRRQRYFKARRLLSEGKTKADVAKAVGLSPSRISAMFKHEMNSIKATLKARQELAAYQQKRAETAAATPKISD